MSIDSQMTEIAIKPIKYSRRDSLINRVGTRSLQGEGMLVALKLLPRRDNQNGAVYWVRCTCTFCERHQGGECGLEYEIRSSCFKRTNACRSCGATIAQSRRWENHSRQSKYVPTPQIDEMLQRIYRIGRHKVADRQGVPTLQTYGQRIGWTSAALEERARQLGLCRPRKNPLWTTQELAILERLAPLRSSKYISAVLREKGFIRSPSAVENKLVKHQLRNEDDGSFTCASLGTALGMSDGGARVRQWVEQGLLKGTNLDNEPPRHGQIVKITRTALKRFLRRHYQLIDLRKVDQDWFFDLIFDGKIGETVNQVLKRTAKPKRKVFFLQELRRGEVTSACAK